MQRERTSNPSVTSETEKLAKVNTQIGHTGVVIYPVQSPKTSRPTMSGR